MLAAPKIGVTTQVIRQAKWYKFIDELGFKAIEINRLNSKLHFNLFFLEKVKRYTGVLISASIREHLEFFSPLSPSPRLTCPY
jgi:hypothetical protein